MPAYTIFNRFIRPIRAKAVLLLAATAVIFSGCTTGNNAILKTVRIGDNPEDIHVLTGARQRLITNHFPKLTTRPGLIDPQRIVCAEPSPDVAVSVANSLSTGLSLFGYGSGSASVQSSEGLAQLAERTVSIQLMQMLMYRTCEAYSNGAIPGTVYNSKMDRIFQTMVTLSLSETAGGNFGRGLAGISGESKGSADASATGLPAGLKGVEDGIVNLAAAEEKVQNAEKAHGDAKLALSNVAADATDETKAPLEDALSERKTELDEAKGERDALRSLLRSEVSTAAEGIASTTVTAGGNLSVTPNEKVAAVLEKMQANYLTIPPIVTYTDACIAELSLGTYETSDEKLKEIFIKNLEKANVILTGAEKHHLAPKYGEAEIDKVIAQVNAAAQRVAIAKLEYDSFKNKVEQLSEEDAKLQKSPSTELKRHVKEATEKERTYQAAKRDLAALTARLSKMKTAQTVVVRQFDQAIKDVARFVWSGRKSGLFQQCEKHLHTALASDAHQRTTIAGYEAETTRLELRVREKEASAKVATSVESALNSCVKLDGGYKEQCLHNVLLLGKVDTPNKTQTFEDLFLRLTTGIRFIPQLIADFETTKNKYENLEKDNVTLGSQIPKLKDPHQQKLKEKAEGIQKTAQKMLDLYNLRFDKSDDPTKAQTYGETEIIDLMTKAARTLAQIRKEKENTRKLDELKIAVKKHKLDAREKEAFYKNLRIDFTEMHEKVTAILKEISTPKVGS